MSEHEVFSRWAEDSHQRRWYDIRYGIMHYIMQLPDKDIRRRLLEMEPEKIREGKEPLPRIIRYRSKRHNEINELQVR